MATLPRGFTTSSSGTEMAPSNGAQEGAAGVKYKKSKSKRLSWTLGRKKSRDDAFVADGSGKLLASSSLHTRYRTGFKDGYFS